MQRSFSALKTRLRSRMVEDRLSSLTVLSRDIDLDGVVDSFAATEKNRRIVLN